MIFKLKKFHLVVQRNYKAFSSREIFDMKFNHEFSPTEEEAILQKLNACELHELNRFAISNSRALKLIAYRKKHGSFKSLQQILTVDNFGHKILNSLCLSILNPPNEEEGLKPVKRMRSYPFVIPELTKERISKIKRVVGITLGPLSISWTGIDADENRVFSWGHHTLLLTPDIKRHNEMQIMDAAYDACEQIPSADTYVLESQLVAGGAQQNANMSINQFRLQFTAMLMVLLNQPSRDIPEYNGVICQRRSLWCRLYGTLIGSERVSAHTFVEGILSGSSGPYTPTKVPIDLSTLYYSASLKERDIMCSSFLLTLCFLDVNVRSLPECLTTLRGRSRVKK